jgi:hypothetical protein
MDRRRLAGERPEGGARSPAPGSRLNWEARAGEEEAAMACVSEGGRARRGLRGRIRHRPEGWAAEQRTAGRVTGRRRLANGDLSLLY